MYHSYFGLKEQVFSIAVDPHYLYMSSQHREALAHLLYGVSSGGFVLLTGEVGTGKTTIVRCLLEQLPEGTDLAIILNPVASAPELLGNICDEFRIPYDAGESSIKVLTDKLYEYLLSNHTQGRNTVLLIDEAQLMRISTLEQIRLLTNLETNTRKLLQIILVGQPELNRLLAKPSLRQLSQRITARYHLHALSLEETYAYISHRLHVGGMKSSEQPFPPDVVQEIHATSRGIPRLINVLCDRMLLGAYSQDKTRIDATVCRQAKLEVLGEEAEAGRVAATPLHARSWLQATGWALVGVLSITLLWQLAGTTPPDADAAVLSVESAAVTEAPAADIPPTVPTTPAASANSPSPIGYQQVSHVDEAAALVELFKALDIPPIMRMHPCDNENAIYYQCEQRRLASWNELRKLSRPAVLRLITPAKMERYAALVGMDDTAASLRFGGALHQLPLAELGPLWSGGITFVWSKPASFREPVSLGAEGPVVGWIAAQFAQLDDQQEPLAENRFNNALAERVKIFQRNHQLSPDGVFGTQTLMMLNEELGLDLTFQNNSPVLSVER